MVNVQAQSLVCRLTPCFGIAALKAVGPEMGREMGVLELVGEAVGEVLLGPALRVAEEVRLGGERQPPSAIHAQLQVAGSGRQRLAGALRRPGVQSVAARLELEAVPETAA